MRIFEAQRIQNYFDKYNAWELFPKSLKPFIEVHEFKKREALCHEGDSLRYLYYLIEGNIKVTETKKNGKVNIVELIFGSGVIGELEMLGSQSGAQRIESMGVSVCLAVPLEKCLSLMLSDVHFLRALCKMMGDKIIKNKDLFTVNQSYPLANNLASHILLVSENEIFDQSLSETAQYLGTSYRHLLRVMADMRANGIIKKTSAGYSIANRADLEILAEKI